MAERRKKPQQIYTLLALEVTDYRATVDASISYEARDKRYFHRDPKVYSFDSSVEIECHCYYPKERADQPYKIHVIRSELFEGEFDTTLDYYQVRRDDGSRKYRTVRGEQVPAYKIPTGIGFIRKVRGEPRWMASAFISPECLSDIPTLLVGVRPSYVSIHEMREGRRRSIVSMTVQTGDPVEE